MKTVTTWINEVLGSPAKLNSWLSRQYVGEMLAADRIKNLLPLVEPRYKSVINKIANDETKHAKWVRGLLKSRNIPLPEVSYKEDRYWKTVLAGKVNINELLAVGAHAEEMRLHRIRAIASDSRFDADIREVFSAILPDEERHAKGFAVAAGEVAVKATNKNHELGLKALGLTV